MVFGLFQAALEVVVAYGLTAKDRVKRCKEGRGLGLLLVAFAGTARRAASLRHLSGFLFERKEYENKARLKGGCAVEGCPQPE